jgi:hypothetical protein
VGTLSFAALSFAALPFAALPFAAPAPAVLASISMLEAAPAPGAPTLDPTSSPATAEPIETGVAMLDPDTQTVPSATTTRGAPPAL